MNWNKILQHIPKFLTSRNRHIDSPLIGLENVRPNPNLTYTLPPIDILTTYHMGDTTVEGYGVKNGHRQIVGIREILESKEFTTTDDKLPIAIGKTISNGPLFFDLAKMSHILIGSGVGVGQSVTLDAIICSLLFKKRPHELKFVLVDFKKCQFSAYDLLKHFFLASLSDEHEGIITNPLATTKIFKALCVEIDNRRALLEKTGTSNIDDYNNQIIYGTLAYRDDLHFLPDIVVIIDEYSDIIKSEMGEEIEQYLLRLISQPRVFGIHVVIATKRPLRDVITDKIKANCPTRIAFRTINKAESILILDEAGAESLIGRGDMLLSHNGKVQHLQASFIQYSEVEAIIQHIILRSDGGPTYRAIMAGELKASLLSKDSEKLKRLYRQLIVDEKIEPLILENGELVDYRYTPENEIYFHYLLIAFNKGLLNGD